MFDPFRSFRYSVEIDGVASAGFSQVSGLDRDTTFEEYREGGVNDFVHKLASVTKYPNLTLKRGLTFHTDLWDWYQKVVDGIVERKTITVVLIDELGLPAWSWEIEGAYPVKWTGPALDASTNTVAAEAVEFAHQGFRRLPGGAGEIVGNLQRRVRGR